MAILVGIDGGFALVGYALCDYRPGTLTVHRMGIVETQKSAKKIPVSEDNVRRARLLHRKLLGLDLGGIYPGAICAEAMSYPRSSVTASKLGIGWGVLTAFAENINAAIVQASPQEIKKACTGSKTASKGELRARLSMDYPSSMDAFDRASITASKAEHCWDALGAVVACLDTEIVRALAKA